MNNLLEPLLAVLQTVFRPMIDVTRKWPPSLAYGLPVIVAALLIVAIRETLPDNLVWLLAILVLAPLLGYMFVVWNERRAATDQRQVLTGNVFYSDGSPATHAIVFVEGVDRQKETDASGWFQIEVGRQDSYTVHATVQALNKALTVRKSDTHRPVSIHFDSTLKSSAPERNDIARFETFIRSLQEVDDADETALVHIAGRDDTPSPMAIGRERKGKILRWTATVDDELFAVTAKICHSRGSYKTGITLRALNYYALPFGSGRSVTELAKALENCGILAPSTESVNEGTYAAMDAKVNPSWDYGPTVRMVDRYIKLCKDIANL